MAGVETYLNMGQLAMHSYLLDGHHAAVEVVEVVSFLCPFLAPFSPFWLEHSEYVKKKLILIVFIYFNRLHACIHHLHIPFDFWDFRLD